MSNSSGHSWPELMETTLHRQLKQHYAGPTPCCEVRVDGFRIDAVRRRTLIEIQHGTLAAIRRKIATLLESHRVLVVKPIVVEKTILKLSRRGGQIVHRRRSPKRGRLIDLFDELVHFTTVFPHPRLVLEVPLVSIEERRYPGHGRRRRWRASDHVVEDQRLVEIHSTHRFRAAVDLLRFLPPGLPQPFHTAHLAASLDIPRWLAQRIAYCLVKSAAAAQTGKQGNTRLYSIATRRAAA
jgi:hypothetical protein